MKHKVCELEGALLDAAVAKAEGYIDADVWWETPQGCIKKIDYEPSDEWSDGGPIIESERITVIATNGQLHAEPLQWCAACGPYGPYIDDSLPMNEDGAMTGPTPLIAAMRAYCASRFGDEVEL